MSDSDNDVTEDQRKCDHGVVFDIEEAKKILAEAETKGPYSFVMGSPGHLTIRKRFPRLCGPCPKGCGFNGIAYASPEHYFYGDW